MLAKKLVLVLVFLSVVLISGCASQIQQRPDADQPKLGSPSASPDSQKSGDTTPDSLAPPALPE